MLWKKAQGLKIRAIPLSLHRINHDSTDRTAVIADKAIQNVWVFRPFPYQCIKTSASAYNCLCLDLGAVAWLSSSTSLWSGWLPHRLASILVHGIMGDAGKVPSVGSEIYLIVLYNNWCGQNLVFSLENEPTQVHRSNDCIYEHQPQQPCKNHLPTVDYSATLTGIQNSDVKSLAALQLGCKVTCQVTCKQDMNLNS